MNEFNLQNVKWFILGCAISSNIRFFTGEGDTNKKFNFNLSQSGDNIVISRGDTPNDRT